MSSHEPERFRARIRQVRRALAQSEVVTSARAVPARGFNLPGQPSDLGDLRARLAHLEQLVQGLQDSVHRESQRQERRLTDLEARLDPAALAAALSKDRRERGL